MSSGLKDFFRTLKISYSAYNFMHSEALQHNHGPYKSLGIKKFLFQSISSKDFAHLPPGEIPWMDKNPGKEEIIQKVNATDFPPEIKKKIIDFEANGFIVLERFFDETTMDSVNHEIENLLKQKNIEFSLGNKIMFANKKSPLIDKITKEKKLTDILDFILGKKVIPFQTINFITGSQQKAHSDSIHMTTYPLGYLIAAWIALEDIDGTQGPVSYYPGSHKLPYVLNDGYERGGNAFTVGADSNYLKYEQKIGSIMQEKQLSKKLFTAKKGDVLIWHANLVHGGEKITNPEKTRKSMVIHYFADDVIKYHEITERPALL